MENKLNDEKLMRLAKKRVKTKQFLKSQGYLFATICVVLTVIYFLINIFTEEKQFFWPIYPIGGLVAAYLIHIIIFLPDLYSNKKSTDDAIQREFEKLKTNS